MEDRSGPVLSGLMELIRLSLSWVTETLDLERPMIQRR
jgi:hypothetical protein